MAGENLTQDQIDRIMSGQSTMDEISRELNGGQNEAIVDNNVLSDGSKTEGSRKHRGLRRTSWRNKPALPHNYRVGDRTVIIGSNQAIYDTGTPKIEAPRYDSPRDYALLTFSLRSGSVRESINSQFRSLISRVSETEHEALARLGWGLLVVKLDTKDGVVKGLYKPYESGLRERGSMLYEHSVIDEVTEDEEGFSGRLENILRGYRSPNRVVPIYVQDQLKPDLLTAINNLEIDPAIECDLGSFPREERKKY